MPKIIINNSLIPKIEKKQNNYSINFLNKNSKSNTTRYGINHTKFKIIDENISQKTNVSNNLINSFYIIKSLWFSFDNNKNYTEEKIAREINNFHYIIGENSINKISFSLIRANNILDKKSIFISDDKVLINIPLDYLNIITNYQTIMIKRNHVTQLKNPKYYIGYDCGYELNVPDKLKTFEYYFYQNQSQTQIIFNSKLINLKLIFNHLTTHILFYFTDTTEKIITDVFKSIDLTINNHKVEQLNSVELQMQMKEHGYKNYRNKQFYFYSFDSQFKSKVPNGGVNLSRLDDVHFRFNLKKAINGNIHILGENLNTMMCRNGVMIPTFAC